MRTPEDVKAARVALYTRAGCHLCENAAAELVAAGIAFAEIDITGDGELEADYGDRIPVIVLDGREHGFWRVEIARLRADLEK